ncbi:pali-domain-containing protein [Meredithblackwellia eburnea MCA 4105]
MVGIRPVTPGTVVVLAGTILLVLVSVSVPLLKSIYFLSASFDATVGSTSVSSGQITLGVWGYCAASSCSNATLGYTLSNFDEVFGVSGIAAEIPSSVTSALTKWLTYVLVLHPVAAAFGIIASLCGLLAHIREFAVTGFTTCFAGIGSSIALLAFIFDMILFYIAKKRIDAAGGKAQIGNAVWMTLAGCLLLMFSGCFFGLGRCLIRKRRPEREASEKSKPQVDSAYAQQMRQDALSGGFGQLQETQPPQPQKSSFFGRKGASNNGSSYSGGLPAFQERNNEIIPLTAVRGDEDEEEHVGYRDVDTRTEAASMVSGVGLGYGRRTGSGQPVSLAPASSYNDPAGGHSQFNSSSNLSAAAAGRREQGGSTSTVTPFVGMNPQQNQSGITDPHYVPSRSPPIAGVAGVGAYRPPVHSPPVEESEAPPAFAFGNSYPPEKSAGATGGYQGSNERQGSTGTAYHSYSYTNQPNPYDYTPSSPPPASSNYESAPSYRTHQPQIPSAAYAPPQLPSGGYLYPETTQSVDNHSVSNYSHGEGHQQEPSAEIAYRPPQQASQTDPYTFERRNFSSGYNPY